MTEREQNRRQIGSMSSEGERPGNGCLPEHTQNWQLALVVVKLWQSWERREREENERSKTTTTTSKALEMGAKGNKVPAAAPAPA